VADISVAKTTIIETLTGVEDGRPEAEAIACEYAREKLTGGEKGNRRRSRVTRSPRRAISQSLVATAAAGV